jgi:hypothetical protein
VALALVFIRQNDNRIQLIASCKWALSLRRSMDENLRRECCLTLTEGLAQKRQLSPEFVHILNSNAHLNFTSGVNISCFCKENVPSNHFLLSQDTSF